MTTATTVAGRPLSGWSRDTRFGTWHALLPDASGEPVLGALRIDQALLGPQGTRERLAAAVLATAKLRLPGLLGTVDLVAEAGEVWLLTARTPAPALADVLSADGPRPDAGSAASILNETAQTLLALHAAGLAHGSLCPDTVFLAPDGVALLSEAGLSTVLGDAPHTEPPTADTGGAVVPLPGDLPRPDRADTGAVAVPLPGDLPRPDRADTGAVAVPLPGGDLPHPDRRAADTAAWAALARTLGAAWTQAGTPAAALFAHCATTAGSEGLAAARAALVAGRAALPADFLRRTALRVAAAASAPRFAAPATPPQPPTPAAPESPAPPGHPTPTLTAPTAPRPGAAEPTAPTSATTAPDRRATSPHPWAAAEQLTAAAAADQFTASAAAGHLTAAAAVEQLAASGPADRSAASGPGDRSTASAAAGHLTAAAAAEQLAALAPADRSAASGPADRSAAPGPADRPAASAPADRSSASAAAGHLTAAAAVEQLAASAPADRSAASGPAGRSAAPGPADRPAASAAAEQLTTSATADQLTTPGRVQSSITPDTEATVLGKRHRITSPPVPAGEDSGEILLRFGPGIPADEQDVLRARWRTEAAVPARQRSRRRHRGWVISTAVVAMAAVLLWLLLRPTPAPAVVAVRVQAPAGTLHCGRTADLVGVVTTDGRGGPVTYRWLRGDGQDSGELVRTAHRGERRLRVHLRWTVRGPGRFQGTARLRIAHQRTPMEAEASFTYVCP
ncbi:hypothetical protein [Streptomyces sp. NPDC048710]|uniref:hypothetical protein n=1 Tax=Streptomyces sp. NPDC048710 TaxID=3365586 RepID=UPI003713E752